LAFHSPLQCVLTGLGLPISSARSVSDMKAHLVLTTKYRKKVLTSDMISRLRDVITDLCEKWDCKVIEFNGEDNHIHLLFQYYPQMELPKLVVLNK
jgi:putative transposase